ERRAPGRDRRRRCGRLRNREGILLGQIVEQDLQLALLLGRARELHTLVELVEIEHTLGKGVLELLHHVIALWVEARFDGGGDLVIRQVGHGQAHAWLGRAGLCGRKGRPRQVAKPVRAYWYVNDVS